MANKRLTVGSLEFDQIKNNLKEFLRGQDTFSDYDFDGSNMSILLDILAYNTYYNSVYTNFALNEVYLDTASKRNSVVSLAKALGYTPRSARCAKTSINFTVSGVIGNPAFLTIPKYTVFQGTNNQTRYSFYTQEDITTNRDDNNEYQYTNVVILEGAPVSQKMTFSDVNYFSINNSMMDISTLDVRVQTPPSSDYEVFNNIINYATVKNDTPVYSIKEGIDNTFEISFGDNVLGKAILSGQIIYLNYMVSSGTGANGISTISYSGEDISGGIVESISLNERVNGGREPETTEEIRFNAPNFYQTQNRAVTATDMESIILNKVSSIDDVIVWGGENNYPPVYGKMFISARTPTGRNLSYNEQQSIITDVINKYKVITVVPEFVDHEVISVLLDVVVYYDKNLTVKTPADIITAVRNLIASYNENNLKKFNKILYLSEIMHEIEGVDISIVSSTPRAKIKRGFTPIFNIKTNYAIDIGNPFIPGTLSSDMFYVSEYSTGCILNDDSKGNIFMYTNINGIHTKLDNIGTIDYSNGTINLLNMTITNTADTTLNLMITPNTNSIIGIHNQIVEIDMTNTNVSVIADNTTDGRINKGEKYIFAPTTI